MPLAMPLCATSVPKWSGASHCSSSSWVTGVKTAINSVSLWGCGDKIKQPAF